MTQQQWDWIGYGVWALIIWMTLKQYRQTRRYVTGSGLSLLLGDWLLFAPLPWIVWRMTERGTWEHAGWVLLIGIGLALPYIATTRFEALPDGIRFKSNRLFLLFLFALPVCRYYVRDHIFHTHPLLFPNHRPDIELMLSEYIGALVVLTFCWRLFMFLSYRRLRSREQAAGRAPKAA